jgi:hypothetical protein
MVIFAGSLLVLERLGRRLKGQIRVSVNESPETGIGFRIGNLPWEPPEDHAHEDDGDAPDISLSGVIGLAGEDFRGEVRIAADDTGGRCMCFTGVMEYSGGSEINELDDMFWSHDAVVKFEITVGEAHFVKVFDTITYLAKYAVDLWAAHLARHDDAKEIKGGVLHNLERMGLEAGGSDRVDSPHSSGRGQRRYQGC